MGITPEVVRELLHYDPDSGVLTWKKRADHWFSSRRICNGWNARHAGQRAGGIHTHPGSGYQCRVVRILGHIRMEHHLAWLWMTDDPLPEEIDHDNRDGTDNRWANLMSSTRPKNGRNQSMQRNNTSGVTGVHWNKGMGKWQGYCHIAGKRRHVGSFDEIDEAAMAVMELRADHGFNPKHGLEVAHYYGGLLHG